MVSSDFLHSWTYFPFNYLLLEFIVLAATSFSKPASPARKIAVGFNAILVFSYYRKGRYEIENKNWASMCGAVTVSWFFISIDRLLINPWSWEARGPESHQKVARQSAKKFDDVKPQETYSWENCISFAAQAPFALRGIGEPWELKGTPLFVTKNPNYVPSRPYFLLRWTAIVLSACLVLDFASSQPSPPPEYISSSAERVFVRIQHVSLPELGVRASIIFGFYLCSYLLIQLCAGVLAIITVASRINKPSSWRPYWGPITESYSIRKFWGTFWHQLLRSFLPSISTYLTLEKPLHLPRGTLTARYANLLISFFISGLIHLGADLGARVPWRESGALRFYCMQAFGIMFEDGVQFLYNKTTGKRKQSGWFERGFGYVWVAAWLIWTTPEFVYPQVRASRPGVDTLLPFRLVNW